MQFRNRRALRSLSPDVTDVSTSLEDYDRMTAVMLETATRPSFTRLFLFQFVCSLIVVIAVLSTRLLSKDLFTFASQTAEITFCANTFLVLSFSSHKTPMVGFFAILGCGHLFIALFVLAHGASILNIAGTFNQGIQAWSSERFIEIGTLFVALNLASTSVNKKFLALMISSLVVATSGLLASIYWWQNFPLLFENNEVTHMHILLDYFYLFSYGMIGILIFRKRQHFHPSIFASVLTSGVFKLLCCVTDGISNPSEGPANPTSLSCKLFSFALIFFSIGLESFRNPVLFLEKKIKLQRQVSASQQTFSDEIIDRAPCIIVVLDEELKIQRANNQAYRTVNKNALEGSSFFEIFANGAEDHAFSLKLVTADISRVLSHTSANNETKRQIEWSFTSIDLLTHDTKKRELMFNVELSMLNMKDTRFTLAVGQDVTYKNIMEDMKKARFIAEENSRLKDDFVSNISHELRTPLNCIVGMNSLLLLSNIDPQQREMITLMNDTSISMIDIVNDLLDFKSFKEGNLHLNPVRINLRRFLEELMQGISVLYQTHSAKIHFACYVSAKCPTFIITDPKRLRQVMLNLLSNAIKATSQGHVIVCTTVVKTLDTSLPVVEFSVEDSGAGIKDITKIFKSNESSEYSASSFAGSGIGLGICKQIVEKMGGLIEFDSQLGLGSRFWFQVPMAPSADLTANLSSNLNDKIKKITSAPSKSSHRFLLYKTERRVAMLTKKTMEKELNVRVELLNSYQEIDDVLLEVLRQEEAGESKLSLLSVILETENVKIINTQVLGKLSELGVAVHAICVTRSFVGIAELHDFTFRVTTVSSPLKMSTFLPLVDSNIRNNYTEMAPVAEIYKVTSPSAERILIVEDNMVNQKVFAMILTRLGYKYDVAENGKEAIDYYQKSQYDIILMDCMMPVMDGFEASAEIRKIERDGGLKHTTIIALTGNVTEDDRRSCMLAGMDDFLPKPIQIEDLKKKLTQYSSSNFVAI